MAKRNWYRLDNSAKIMPPTTTNLNTNVFRLSCTLLEEYLETIKTINIKCTKIDERHADRYFLFNIYTL